MTRSFLQRIKRNHAVMMLVCCIVPLALVFALVYFFGLSKSYLYWVVLLLCPIMHYFMMRQVHDKKSKKGGCH